MKIGILSQPSNFHCQKWASALQKEGVQVVVFTLEKTKEKYNFEVIQVSKSDTYKYMDFHRYATKLKHYLQTESVDVLHPLHITPYGTWGRLSGFRPLIPAAMGADIFEYPPYPEWKNIQKRAWAAVSTQRNWIKKIKSYFSYLWFKWQVAQTLQCSDFITADNIALQKAIVQWFHIPSEKVQLIRWGVDAALLTQALEILPQVCAHLGIPLDKRLILSPRGAMAVYQADIIIDAFEQCLEAGLYPNHTYIMLSAGYSIAPEIRHKALIMSEKYKNFIWVDKQLPRTWVAALWHICDIFISIPIYDGFSASVSEGMWMGCIPLVNAIPGNMELIQNERNGWIVEQLNSTTLFQRLSQKEKTYHSDKERFSLWNQTWVQNNALLSVNARQWIELLHTLK